MEEFPAFGTTRDLAELVQKPESSVRHWRQQGTGPAYFRLGKSVRYRREDVESWIAEQIQREPASA